MHKDFLEEIKKILVNSQANYSKEWLSLKEAATYAGVSYNTFIKFREMGLRVAEIESVKRVSRKEIDTFFENHSY
ncbi:DNA-binding protein [Rummeliibacillus sp. TYF005]|uniref:helix-turn-helix domain-containing protein n=1 Tax=Rummeliibacillus sp. TYF005 TaxID=2058214 RepID=UPI000F52D639|nr:helix-turn-helix domain-containing protein [Rummeliibacillus sp. TYF005]RPJ94085.1 DNA-binding protein [Rummeliibacillus sp. TYF005]